MAYIIHGGYGTPEYSVWRALIGRCHCKTNKQYPNYGARGISVCDEWRASFSAFFRDMGKRPENKSCIDRIDNNGNYEPSNCRWATARESTNNRRVTKMITFRGTTLPLSEWAEKLGKSYNLLADRIMRYGWTPERAFTEAAQKKKISVFHAGISRTFKEWSAITGIKKDTIRDRFNEGWPSHLILSSKIRPHYCRPKV